jgi:hypothetical protein
VAADLIDRLARRFQQAHGLLDARVPEVGLRAAPGSGREAAGQGALAQPEPGRELADPERAANVQVDVLLDLVHELVVVRPLAAERDVRELARAVAVDQQDLGGQVGAVVTGEALDQVPMSPLLPILTVPGSSTGRCSAGRCCWSATRSS